MPRLCRVAALAPIAPFLIAPLLIAPRTASAQATAQPAAGPAVASIQILPRERTMTARDTMRLRARALDAQGNDVPGAVIRFSRAGGYFEGTVEPDGLVRSGSTGTIPLTVSATVLGRQPVIERLEVKMLPGPAHHIVVTTAVSTLAIGQRMRYLATA